MSLKEQPEFPALAELAKRGLLAPDAWSCKRAQISLKSTIDVPMLGTIIEQNDDGLQWSHNTVWNKRYMKPRPGSPCQNCGQLRVSYHNETRPENQPSSKQAAAFSAANIYFSASQLFLPQTRVFHLMYFRIVAHFFTSSFTFPGKIYLSFKI